MLIGIRGPDGAAKDTQVTMPQRFVAVCGRNRQVAMWAEAHGSTGFAGPSLQRRAVTVRSNRANNIDVLWHLDSAVLL